MYVTDWAKPLNPVNRHNIKQVMSRGFLFIINEIYLKFLTILVFVLYLNAGKIAESEGKILNFAKQ